MINRCLPNVVSEALKPVTLLALSGEAGSDRAVGLRTSY